MYIVQQAAYDKQPQDRLGQARGQEDMHQEFKAATGHFGAGQSRGKSDF